MQRSSVSQRNRYVAKRDPKTIPTTTIKNPNDFEKYKEYKSISFLLIIRSSQKK